MGERKRTPLPADQAQHWVLAVLRGSPSPLTVAEITRRVERAVPGHRLSVLAANIALEHLRHQRTAIAASRTTWRIAASAK